MRRGDLVQLLGPIGLVVLVGIIGSLGFVSPDRQVEILGALVSVAIVVSLYVFVGNSGVVSFGHVSFVAVGAFAAGVMTIPVTLKPTITPGLFSLLARHSLGNVPSLVLAALVGGVFALLVGIPLMRLSGLSAGIATFAVLGVTHNILANWTKVGPGPLTLTTIPQTTGMLQGTLGAVGVVLVAFAYQRSRFGRKLRAAREDPAAARAAGIDIHRERLWAFALSGTLCGFAGGLFVHQAGTLQAGDVYLDLTFLTLAMLVVGGVGSLWGAVVGALVVSALGSFLLDAENGDVGFVNDLLGKPLWGGSRLVGVAAFMALVLVLLPSGLTNGREFGLPRLPRIRRPVRGSAS
ncbi:MAG: branched-chain amino acid ABC transporter permease [Actinobacteria bacterium]|nr:MAG: branched-chain amino acid ABC transporter permease [Actinomycetota bacterium]